MGEGKRGFKLFEIKVDEFCKKRIIYASQRKKVFTGVMRYEYV